MAEGSAAGFAFVVSRESRNLATTVAPSDAAHPHGTTRRDFLSLAPGAGAAVGAAALAWPFVASMAPDAETVAAGAPIEVDLTPITEGQIINVFWRGKLIFVRRLTQKEIGEMKAVEQAEILEDHAHAPPQAGERVAGDAAHLLAEHRDEAAARPGREQDQAQQRGLARTRRPGEELERVRGDREADVAQHLRAHAVAHAHVLEPDDGLLHPGQEALPRHPIRSRRHALLVARREA
jgi:hypothetical protein